MQTGVLWGVAAALEDDSRADTESEKARLKAEDARREYLDRISALPFPERAEKVLTDGTITWREWRSEWGRCAPGDLAHLDLLEVQRLVDRLEGEGSSRWEKALRSLYDRRHEIRLGAMEAPRRELGHLPAGEQLREMLRRPSVPVEHYPAELAAEATPDWFSGWTLQTREGSLSLPRALDSARGGARLSTPA